MCQILQTQSNTEVHHAESQSILIRHYHLVIRKHKSTPSKHYSQELRMWLGIPKGLALVASAHSIALPVSRGQSFLWNSAAHMGAYADSRLCCFKALCFLYCCSPKRAGAVLSRMCPLFQIPPTNSESNALAWEQAEAECRESFVPGTNPPTFLLGASEQVTQSLSALAPSSGMWGEQELVPAAWGWLLLAQYLGHGRHMAVPVLEKWLGWRTAGKKVASCMYPGTWDGCSIKGSLSSITLIKPLPFSKLTPGFLALRHVTRILQPGHQDSHFPKRLFSQLFYAPKSHLINI